MSLIISESNGSNISILEEGSYPAVCYLLADIGYQYSEQYGTSSPKVIIGWEVAGEFVEIDGEKHPRTFFTRYTASLNEKAILRRDLAAWRGRDFTAAELSEFNLRNIVGAPCLIQIIHKKAQNGKTYANLASVMKLPKGMPIPQMTLDAVVYDIEEDDPEKIKMLPDWIAKQIVASETYQRRVAGTTGGAGGMSELEELSGELPF